MESQPIARKRIEVIAAMLLVAAYVAVPVVLLPHICLPEQAYKRTSWALKFWCDVNASDFAVGLFTLFLVIATYFLWCETERVARGDDDQADKWRDQ